MILRCAPFARPHRTASLSAEVIHDQKQNRRLGAGSIMLRNLKVPQDIRRLELMIERQSAATKPADKRE